MLASVVSVETPNPPSQPPNCPATLALTALMWNTIILSSIICAPSPPVPLSLFLSLPLSIYLYSSLSIKHRFTLHLSLTATLSLSLSVCQRIKRSLRWGPWPDAMKDLVSNGLLSAQSRSGSAQHKAWVVNKLQHSAVVVANLGLNKGKVSRLGNGY